MIAGECTIKEGSGLTKGSWGIGLNEGGHAATQILKVAGLGLRV